MSRELKLFNGRLLDFQHGYIAAYSRADAVRLYDEFIGGRGTLPEIRDYWNKGSWGNSMIGVTPRRGMFAQTKDGALVEFTAFGKHKPLERDDPEAWEAYQAKQQSERDATQADAQRAREERRERLRILADGLCLDDATFDGDVITFSAGFEQRSYRYEIREID
ncbi:MAG TPA: hypothetical protein VFX97_16975 [Pyrinomonadaceae bacterium]|nr:hypothetical protein [Pyrinomonadaceae bacterium]